MPAPGFATLICPPGAEQAMVSFGECGYRPYMNDPADSETMWLVDVPMQHADAFCRTGGFKLLE
jgi:hypothetical protein